MALRFKKTKQKKQKKQKKKKNIVYFVKAIKIMKLKNIVKGPNFTVTNFCPFLKLTFLSDKLQ